MVSLLESVEHDGRTTRQAKAAVQTGKPATAIVTRAGHGLAKTTGRRGYAVPIGTHVAPGTTNIRAGLAVGAAAAVAVTGLAVAGRLACKVMGRNGAHGALLLAAATVSAKLPDVAGLLVILGASSTCGNDARVVLARMVSAEGQPPCPVA
jgi:hypothetical protein